MKKKNGYKKQHNVSAQSNPSSPRENPNANESVSSDEEYWECTMCMHPISGGVWQCKSGHLLCGDCHVMCRSTCPTCGVALEGIRNRALERLRDRHCEKRRKRVDDTGSVKRDAAKIAGKHSPARVQGPSVVSRESAVLFLMLAILLLAVLGLSFSFLSRRSTALPAQVISTSMTLPEFPISQGENIKKEDLSPHTLKHTSNPPSNVRPPEGSYSKEAGSLPDDKSTPKIQVVHPPSAADAVTAKHATNSSKKTVKKGARKRVKKPASESGEKEVLGSSNAFFSNESSANNTWAETAGGNSSENYEVIWPGNPPSDNVAQPRNDPSVREFVTGDDHGNREKGVRVGGMEALPVGVGTDVDSKHGAFGTNQSLDLATLNQTSSIPPSKTPIAAERSNQSLVGDGILVPHDNITELHSNQAHSPGSESPAISEPSSGPDAVSEPQETSVVASRPSSALSSGICRIPPPGSKCAAAVAAASQSLVATSGAASSGHCAAQRKRCAGSIPIDPNAPPETAAGATAATAAAGAAAAAAAARRRDWGRPGVSGVLLPSGGEEDGKCASSPAGSAGVVALADFPSWGPLPWCRFQTGDHVPLTWEWANMAETIGFAYQGSLGPSTEAGGDYAVWLCIYPEAVPSSPCTHRLGDGWSDMACLRFHETLLQFHFWRWNLRRGEAAPLVSRAYVELARPSDCTGLRGWTPGADINISTTQMNGLQNTRRAFGGVYQPTNNHSDTEGFEFVCMPPFLLTVIQASGAGEGRRMRGGVRGKCLRWVDGSAAQGFLYDLACLRLQASRYFFWAWNSLRLDPTRVLPGPDYRSVADLGRPDPANLKPRPRL